MNKNRMPTGAGILNILFAFHGIIIVFLDIVQGPSPGSFSHWSSWAFLIQTALSILAAICSFKRRFWVIAVAGSIPGIIYYLLGVLAVVFLYKSRSEFRN